MHIRYNHECPKCQALYIPYDKEVPCPKCGLVEKTRFDFLPQAVRSCLANLDRHASFLPLGWYYSSDADYLQMLIFKMLNKHRKTDNTKSFAAVAREFIDTLNWDDWKWEDRDYDKEFIFNLACRVHEEIQKKMERK